LGLGFHTGASHDPRPGIFLAHDFQDMDGEPGDFIVSEGHKHPLVQVEGILMCFCCCWKALDNSNLMKFMVWDLDLGFEKYGIFSDFCHWNFK